MNDLSRYRTHRSDGWWTRSLCQWWNPSMWYFRGVLTAKSRLALAICDVCPVRAQCRDDFRKMSPRPRSIIAGGWRWNDSGQATPHRDDPVSLVREAA